MRRRTKRIWLVVWVLHARSLSPRPIRQFRHNATAYIFTLSLFSLTCNQSAIRSNQKIARKRLRSDATLGSFPDRLISTSSSPPPPSYPLLLPSTTRPYIHKAAADAHSIARAAPNAPAGVDAVDDSLDVAADKTSATAKRDFHELLPSSIKIRWVLGDIIFVNEIYLYLL
jgi:hypothetical protein